MQVDLVFYKRGEDMIKVIAFDIDNTLAELDKPMLDSTMNKLKQLEQSGIQLVFISGRPVSYVTGFVRQIGLNSPIVSGSNGGVIKYSITVPPNKVFQFEMTEYQALTLKALKEELEMLMEESIWLQPNLTQVSAFHYTKDACLKLERILDEKFIDETFKNQFKSYYFHDCIDVMPIQISKGNGVLHILETLKILPNETIAVGDSVNDYSMLKIVGHPIGINIQDPNMNLINVKNITEALNQIQILINDQD